MLKLQFRDRRREAIWLVDQSFTIGKSANNSLMIQDSSVLEQHAEIIQQGGQLILMDKSAGKGCWVNGEVITSHTALKQNDIIKLGSVELVLIDPKNMGSVPDKVTQSRPADGIWSIHSKASWLEQSRFNIGGRIIIGRDESCDITLPLDHLSRRHCALEVKGGQLHVEDLESSNGTYVNGERVSASKVQSGDKIKLDVVTFEVDGPSHDPNKTIIRSVPSAQKPEKKSSTQTKADRNPGASVNKPLKRKKLAANGKQDWISGHPTEPATKTKTGMIVAAVILITAVIGALLFI